MAVLQRSITCPAVPGRKACIHGGWLSHDVRTGEWYNQDRSYTCESCEVQGVWRTGELHVCWLCESGDGLTRQWNDDGSSL